MKTFDFINSNIGEYVYVTGDHDLAFLGEFRPLIYDKTKLKLIKLTKGGNAYLFDESTNKYYSVPARNVRLYSELNIN